MDKEAFAIGYNGSPIFFVAENVLAFKFGNSLRFLHLKEGSAKTVLGLGKGITAFTFSLKAQRYAYSESGVNSRIFVCSYPEHRNVVQLEGNSEVEFEDICFSRDGTCVAAISGLPECKLVVWNCETQAILLQTRIPVPHSPLNNRFYLSFNPRNANQLCLSGNGKLIFFKIENAAEPDHLESEVDLSISNKKCTNSLQRDSAADKETHFLNHLWTADNKVYCGTSAGEVLKYDSTNSELLETHVVSKDANSSIAAMLLTRTHLVVGTKSGTIVWLAINSKNISENNENNNSAGFTQQQENTVTLGTEITALAFSVDYRTLTIGTAINNLEILTLGEGALPLPGSKPEKVIDHHKGIITGIDTLSRQHTATNKWVRLSLAGWSHERAVITPGNDTYPNTVK